MVLQVAIAGITSKLAQLIAEELLKRSDVRLRGSCRDVTKVPQILRDAPEISLVQCGPYNEDALRSLVKGCDVVICCYLADNEIMWDGQKVLIDLCEEEGVPRYIASDYTANYTKLEYGDVVIKDPMKQVKAYLEEKSTVKGVHILVGLLMETYWEYFSNWNAEEKSLSYWGMVDDQWDMTSYLNAAQYVTAVALDPSAIGVYKCRSRSSMFAVHSYIDKVCQS